MIPLLLIISILCAVAWHGLLRIFWLSVLGSTVMAVLLFWFVSSSHIGVTFLDFENRGTDFIYNISIAAVVSFVVSLLIGGIFWSRRKAQKK